MHQRHALAKHLNFHDVTRCVSCKQLPKRWFGLLLLLFPIPLSWHERDDGHSIVRRDDVVRLNASFLSCSIRNN